MSDVPPAPSSPCEIEPLLKGVLRVAGPLLAPPTPQTTPPVTPSQTMQAKEAGKSVAASRVETDAKMDNSVRSDVKDSNLAMGQKSTLSALMVTLGPHGFMIVRRCEEGAEDSPLLSRPVQQASESGPLEDVICQEGTYHSMDRVVGLHFPPPDYDQIVSVSGAGDCLASGFVTGMLSGLNVSECAAVGNTAARLSLQALPTVPPTLSTLRAAEGGAALRYNLIC